MTREARLNRAISTRRRPEARASLRGARGAETTHDAAPHGLGLFRFPRRDGLRAWLRRFSQQKQPGREARLSDASTRRFQQRSAEG
jgi:hypothetical protein